MSVTKRTIKKINATTNLVEEKVNPTDEELILGKQAEKKVAVEVNHESENIKYKVTNLEVKNTPIIVTGDVVEAFIGSNNKTARNALKAGEKVVITRNINGKELYKIEVIE